jgi:polyhydroxybutyrate depolymerase
MRPICLAVLLCLTAGARTVVAAPNPARPSAGCRADSFDRGRPLRLEIGVGETTRSYLLDVPDSIATHKPVALVFDFHGFQHSAEGVWRVSRFKDLSPTERFITAYPDGLPVHLLERDGAGWEIFKIDGNRDLAFVKQMLDHLERTYCIDLNRIYATGFSNGAFLSNLLACSMADTFAAVAPVSGGRLSVPCTASRYVPVIAHHGRNDPLIAVTQAREMRDAWVEKNACHGKADGEGCETYRGCRDGAEVIYCEDDGAHSWPPAATKRIWEFFKAHPMKLSH